jgi:hypothetical protein
MIAKTFYQFAHPMEQEPKFTERERTAAQRQDLIDKARAWSVAQGATPDAEAEALYARYVGGTLTLQGITDALRAADKQRMKPERRAELLSPNDIVSLS